MNAPDVFRGKKIWVTGGAGYLGTPITCALDAQAEQVICFDLAGRAEALVAERKLARTQAISADVNDAAGLPALVEKCVNQYGVPDGVVHLAFVSSVGKTFENLTAAEFQLTFDRAITPTFVLCRELAQRMQPRGSGSIVLFSSMYGMVSPDPRIYHAPMTTNPIDYGASKAAILQMARYLAVHYGPSGLRFNCVTPGPFPNQGVRPAPPSFIADLSRKTALNRIGQNSEIVGPTLFLLSDAASYVTGHSLVVDGGWTAW
ncbi:MAG: Gluconate 5-dehydrogenase [Verrucomicrobia bacterium]|nr:Gluconate 5-dehydrogenase [Verrucomicrobiota bacterium]